MKKMAFFPWIGLFCVLCLSPAPGGWAGDRDHAGTIAPIGTSLGLEAGNKDPLSTSPFSRPCPCW